MPRVRPSVTVVIPNYNYAKTLRACLESVFAQSHAPVEVIVVDDASTDRSREIAAAFPCTVLAIPTNRGVSAARNLGAARARGDVLFFLDSDTALAPDALANAVDLLLDDPETGCVHGVLDPEPLFDDGPVERYHALHAHFWRRRGAGVVSGRSTRTSGTPRTSSTAAGW
jgi:glycosyltransferase involved in cell wall biosynthesis